MIIMYTGFLTISKISLDFLVFRNHILKMRNANLVRPGVDAYLTVGHERVKIIENPFLAVILVNENLLDFLERNSVSISSSSSLTYFGFRNSNIC